jgi:hypothetical protein
MLGMSVKMVIEAYKDEKFTQKASPDSFTLQINPESFSLKHEAVNGNPVRDASSEEVNRVASPSRKTLSLNFPLDQSGVMLLPLKNSKLTLTDTIKLFLDVCIKVNGTTHISNYLKIRWGDFTFPCRCDSADIDYRLFNPLGKPVRVIVNADFTEFIDEETEEKLQNKNSPDMSHLVTIREGDSLPALCYDIYGSSSYYLQVARINKLSSFRTLKAGSRILFPRLEK